MNEKELGAILRRLIYNAKIRIRAVVISACQLVAFDLICKEVIKESFKARKWKFADLYGDTDSLLKGLLTSNSLITLLSTFVRRKTDTSISYSRCSTACATNDRINSIVRYNKLDEPQMSYSDPGSQSNTPWKDVKTLLKTSIQQPPK